MASILKPVEVPQKTPLRVLFVCTANICRSPLAQAIFMHQARQRGVADKVQADSAGVADIRAGEETDPRALEVLQDNGIEFNHIARQIKLEDFIDFDFIVCMDAEQLYKLMAMCPTAKLDNRIYLLRHVDPQGPGNVPDPYWGDIDVFHELFHMLSRSCSAWLDTLTKTTAPKPVITQTRL